jgi:hypothetical protein
MLRSVRKLLGAWLRREHTPSPFFDESGEPRATPKLLTDEELRALKRRVGGQES